MFQPGDVMGFVHAGRQVARGNEENQDDEQHFGQLPQRRLRHGSRLGINGGIGIHRRFANSPAERLMQPNRIKGYGTGDLGCCQFNEPFVID